MDRNGGGFFRIAPPGISRNRGSQGPAPYQCTSPSQTTVCPLSLQVGMELAFLASRVHKEKAGSSRKALQPAQPAQHTCPAVAEPFIPHGEELAFNPPIRVQDCSPFQQPLRPLEIRGTKVHLDPQEPAGSEGPSSCAFELSMRGRLSDLVLEGRLQGAAYAILEVDSSWVWLLSAYGLYSPKASRVVEQLLRKVRGHSLWALTGGNTCRKSFKWKEQLSVWFRASCGEAQRKIPKHSSTVCTVFPLIFHRSDLLTWSFPLSSAVFCSVIRMPLLQPAMRGPLSCHHREDPHTSLSGVCLVLQAIESTRRAHTLMDKLEVQPPSVFLSSVLLEKSS